jgi:NAD(P)H-flavin reductase
MSAPAEAPEDRSGLAGTAADWYETSSWRVTQAHRESRDTVTLTLEPPGRFGFDPGQFNMMYVPGVGEAPISISGDPADTTRVLHTVRAVGPVTRALCAARAGDTVGVRGPFGTSWPLRQAQGGDLVIVAGGIGLPPLRPVIHHVLAHRDAYRRVILLYGARTPDDLLFTGELKEWQARCGLIVEVTVDSAARDWQGHVGVVPDLISRVELNPVSTTAFTVGPEIMMRFTVRALLAAGVSADRVFLSMERGMRCAVALCGHCQFGPYLICRDGPVFGYPQVDRWLRVREL